MASSQKRIAVELRECTQNPPHGMTISLPSESDVNKWTITLQGPPDSLYAKGVYKLALVLPPDYPFKAPQITFTTRIYHPNVTNDHLGNICLSIIKAENWKPACRIRAVLESIRQLLVEPNPDDPLEPRIADEYRMNPAEFEKNVRGYVERYASGK